MKYFFLIFVLIPLIEIYFLIEIGSMVGVGWTILLVVFTALLGAFLVQVQGINTFFRVQNQVAQGTLPAMEMIEGLLLFVAGALLLTPGFFTDSIGFILLVPPLRRALIRYVVARQAFNHASGWTFTHAHAPKSQSGRVIDVDPNPNND